MAWLLSRVRSAVTTTQSLPAWGVQSWSLNVENVTGGSLQLDTTIAAWATTAVFQKDDIVRLIWDAGGGSLTTRFVGKIIDSNASANPAHKGRTFVAWDALLQASRRVFQQLVKKWAGTYTAGVPDMIQVANWRLIMNMSDAGALLDTKEQLEAIVDYLRVSCGILVATASDYPAVDVFTSEHQGNLYCSQAIESQRRLLPDTVAWMDHSTDNPGVAHSTLKLKRRAALAVVTRDIAADGYKVQDISMTPLYSRQPGAVILRYERLDQTTDGSTVYNPSQDGYPGATLGTEENAMVANISLLGQQMQVFNCKLKTAAWDPTALSWWVKRTRELAQTDAYGAAGSGSPTITAAAAVDEAGASIALGSLYGYEILDGNVADWMESSGALWKTVHVTAKVRWTVKVGGVVQFDKDEILRATVRMTNVNSGGVLKNYSLAQLLQAAETPPTGLAQSIYDALNVLEYAGSYSFRESECTFAVRVGDVLRLTGGETAWATMNATVQAVTYRRTAAGAETVVRLGPPGHLGAEDIIELSRAHRFRRETSPIWIAVRTTGFASTGSNADFPVAGKVQDSGRGPTQKFRDLMTDEVTDSGDEGGYHIVFDPVDAQPGSAVRTFYDDAGTEITTSGGKTAAKKLATRKVPCTLEIASVCTDGFRVVAGVSAFFTEA